MSTLKSKPPKAFLARLKERVRLNPGSEKETFHLVLDISGSGMTYSVGDCLGVHPENDPTYIDQLVAQLKAPHLRDFLLRKANLHRIPKKLLGEHPDFHTLLSYHPPKPEALQENLLPLLPRFYSIASSMEHVGEEVHLTVTVAKNPPHAPVPYGVCSHYLCYRAPINEPVIPVFVQPSRHFSLPKESCERPIIMIGPGTGVAPFRAFMQERTCTRNWLFFGERNQTCDFYYRSFWEEHITKGSLRLDSAFSRDQAEKIYVQHRLLERKKEVWQWLQEGAYLFVCGDASKMAKDVDQALQTIAIDEGTLAPDDAKAYFKQLRKEKRYLRDVY